MEISLISQMFLPDSCGIDGEQMETLSDEKMPGLSKVLHNASQKSENELSTETFQEPNHLGFLCSHTLCQQRCSVYFS